MKKIVIVLSLLALIASSCATKSRYVNDEYRRLLMLRETPKEVYGILCEGGLQL
ncbi:MAG: hypothetical protein FWC39_02685 [Bacteroidetes bacterium]|nr:hypothetical protein [Bacteroidota bacterium]